MSNETDDLRTEYDFDLARVVRGKYYKQYVESIIVVVQESGVATDSTRLRAPQEKQ